MDFSKPHLLSPQDGNISHLLLSWGTTDMIIGHVGLLQARPDIQRATVLLPESQWQEKPEKMAEAYRNIMRGYGIQTEFDFVPVASGQIPSFPQDDLQVLVESGTTYILHGMQEIIVGVRGCGTLANGTCPNYISPTLFADPLCQTLGAQCVEIDSMIDGGNLLSTGAHLFAGVENQNPDALQSLKQFGETGDVVPIGESANRQASFHIDMFVTPTEVKDPVSRKPIVFVGDIHLAKRALQKLPQTTLQTYEALWEGAAMIWDHFFQEAGIYNYFKQKPGYLSSPGLQGKLVDAIYHSSPEQDEMSKVLDENAAELAAKDFHVIRIPLLYSDGYITYNNVLIEGNKITMPVYQVPELDALATTIYKQAGFEVVPAKGFELISLERSGSLHCSVKELERTANASLITRK